MGALHHAAFCDHILPVDGPGAFTEMRQSLRRSFALPLPEGAIGDDYDLAAHRTAFGVFLTFVKANLNGQTHLRIDPAWASQLVLLQGFAGFAPPDMILREQTLAKDLARLAEQVGRPDAPVLTASTDPHRSVLEGIYDQSLEGAARDAYPRDFEVFGFGNWT